jgi:FKBP-type peptidyl-prolyl cis-trans isomerase (trigger factor)
MLNLEQIQQELIALRQERDEARTQAAQWRQRYQTEAEQRRTDAVLAQQVIANPRVESRSQRSPDLLTEIDPEKLTSIHQEVESYHNFDMLKSKLVEAQIRCEQLLQALKAEQADHSKTRQSLTTALGEAIDTLTRK